LVSAKLSSCFKRLKLNLIPRVKLIFSDGDAETMIMFYYAWNIPTGAGFNPSVLITKFFSSDYLSLDIQRRSSHWEKLACFSGAAANSITSCDGIWFSCLYI
jgi:hypothetical protein